MSQQEKTIDPIVSVILPTYNRGKVIKRSANSILYQTYDDFEIIVIDDGSSDNTEEIIRSLRDPRIRYIRQDANCGPSYARNIGIKAARGKYIAFQDSDDVWVPDKLEKQMNIFRTFYIE